MSKEEFLWVEKYRPQTVDECILPDRYKEKFKEYIKKGEVQNLLLHGGPGMGKTTVALALCEEMGMDVLFINASENGNIDILRTNLRKFASTVSLTGKGKVVILDEADYLNPNSTMPALRSFLEEFSKNCRFIFTANYPNRIIKELRSRLSEIEFKFTKQESASLASQLLKRVEFILTTESVEYDKKVVAEFIMKYFPDFRKVLGELQGFAGSGIVGDVMHQLSADEMAEVISYLKKKEFTKMRKWVAEHTDHDPVMIMRNIVDSAYTIFQKKSIPDVYLIMGERDYKNAFATDKEINLVGFFTELFFDCEFL